MVISWGDASSAMSERVVGRRSNRTCARSRSLIVISRHRVPPHHGPGLLPAPLRDPAFAASASAPIRIAETIQAGRCVKLATPGETVPSIEDGDKFRSGLGDACFERGGDRVAYRLELDPVEHVLEEAADDQPLR